MLESPPGDVIAQRHIDERDTLKFRNIRPAGNVLAVLGVSLVALLGFGSAAQAAEPGTIQIGLTAGSGHLYTGSYDACTGAFTATGTTQGEKALYTEKVTGTYNATTGALSYTSTYVGSVYDGTGDYNPYSYTVTATVTGASYAGSYVVTKTSDPAGVTTTESGSFASNQTWFDAQSGPVTCAAPDTLTNHGQYVSGAAKAGVKNPELAAIAKDKTKVGPYPG
jgi:hypothetical protein